MNKLVLLAVLCGCLPATSYPSFAKDKIALACGGQITWSNGNPQLSVSAASSDCDWPFTAQSLTLTCDASRGTTAITAATDDGTVYALSDEASGLPNVQAIDAIVKDDPSSSDGKADRDTWSDIGLSLCR